MRIGELAARAGVSVRSLRYYEDEGLLQASRSSGGHRHYGEEALERVQLIQLLYSSGLASRTIRALLPCVEARESTPESRTILAAERERIDQQIARLVAARDRLDAVIASSGEPAGG